VDLKLGKIYSKFFSFSKISKIGTSCQNRRNDKRWRGHEGMDRRDV